MELLQRAIEAHEKIFPCGNSTSLNDCFTTAENRLYFWFNTEDKSTHIMFHTLHNEEEKQNKENSLIRGASA